MRTIISPSEVCGAVIAPPSKSYTHRAIMCGLLSSGLSRIHNPLICDDTRATINASQKMGATINNGKWLEIESKGVLKAPSELIDCGGSGTTLRFFTSLAALTDGVTHLSGDCTLQARPIGELISALCQVGVKASSMNDDNTPPVSVTGSAIQGGSVKMRGDISSQFISAMLIACSKAEHPTEIQLTTKLESLPYVKITIDVMKRFGAHVSVSEDWSTFHIPPEQEYYPTSFHIEGDYSSAAFLMAAGALNGIVSVSGLNNDSLQSDAMILEYLRQMGASVDYLPTGAVVRTSDLQPIDANVEHTPDLVPILAVLASQAHGTSKLYNARRLRIKESNRLSTTRSELEKMNVNIVDDEASLIIEGPCDLKGATIDPHKDHRIAMSCAVAALIADGDTTIDNIECISKSYPNFIRDMQSLGSQTIVITEGCEP